MCSCFDSKYSTNFERTLVTGHKFSEVDIWRGRSLIATEQEEQDSFWKSRGVLSIAAEHAVSVSRIQAKSFIQTYYRRGNLSLTSNQISALQMLLRGWFALVVKSCSTIEQ